MAPKKIAKQYKKLQRSLGMASITQEKYLDEISKLSYLDENGILWLVDPENGDLVSNKTNERKIIKNGVLASRNTSKNHSQNNNQQINSIHATHLTGLLSINWLSFVRQILGRFFSRFRIMITIGIIAFVLHTFLLAVGNNGYDKDSPISSMFSQLKAYSPTIFSGKLPLIVAWTIGDFKVGSNIAIKRNVINATAGWTLGGALLLLVWRGYRRKGFFGGISHIFSTPKRVVNSCGPSVGINLIGLASGVIFAHFFSDMLPHQSQNMLSFLSLGILGSMFPMAIGSLLARLANSMTKVFKVKFLKHIGFTGLSQVIILGLSAGMFSKSCWQHGPILAWALGIYTIYLIIMRSNKTMPISPKVSSFLAFTAAIGAIMALSENSVFAHDKGWWENVNQNDPLLTQITSWINADGSTELMKAGIPPAIGAALGAGAIDAASQTTLYVLQVNTHYLEVTPKQSGELLIAVWKSEEGSTLVPAGDASISITAMNSSSWLTMSQTSGICRLNCLVGQQAEASTNSIVPEPITLNITGSGGGQHCTSTVSVSPGGAPMYILEVF